MTQARHGADGNRDDVCRRLLLPALLLLATFASGCSSLERMARNAVADSLAEGGSVYATDDDIDLVGQATPFALKTIESLLAADPDHRGLLQAAASGFTQYAYAYVQLPADEVESTDIAAAYRQRARARRLYLRARDYGLRGLTVAHPGFTERLRRAPADAAALAEARDVPLLYWTAASWAAAISLGKDDPELVAGLAEVEALVGRALALDEGYGAGDLHAFLIAWEAARLGGGDAALARAREHFERAVVLSGGRKAGPYVTYAESVTVSEQDRRAFERLLGTALAIDPAAQPEWTLANRVAQRRAAWLIDNAGLYFSE